jgi:hypothetical protein
VCRVDGRQRGSDRIRAKVSSSGMRNELPPGLDFRRDLTLLVAVESTERHLLGERLDEELSAAGVVDERDAW